MTRTQERVPLTRPFRRSLSRYDKSPVYREGVIEFLASASRKTLPFTNFDTYHTVSAGEEGRLDLISYKYYGTSLLWWVIADANDLEFPMRDTTAGLVLRIPPETYVFSNIV